MPDKNIEQPPPPLPPPEYEPIKMKSTVPEAIKRAAMSSNDINKQPPPQSPPPEYEPIKMKSTVPEPIRRAAMMDKKNGNVLSHSVYFYIK